MHEKQFDPKKLHKLNNPRRLQEIPPGFIAEKAGIENPKVIIDLGAGTGFFSIPFADTYKECTVYACDISAIMIDWMKKNISPHYNRIIPINMEDNHVPLKDNIADFLFMINLHHELDSPEKTLKECYRLLKPEGKIAISDWKKEKTGHGPPLEIRYNPDEVKEQLHGAGFVNISIHTQLAANYVVIAEK